MEVPSDADQADRAVTAITRLGRASGFQGDPDRFATGLACEAAKEMLIRRAKALIGESLGSPVLSSKSCDGTPIRTKFHASGTLPSGKRVKSSGKQGREILVSNQFLRFKHPVEGWRGSCLLSEPVPLTCTKSAPAILSAARKTWASLRSLGATKCCVEHYCWDRAGITALEREVREWHLTQPVPMSDDGGTGVQELLEFVLVTACALHDGQNAFRWGLLSHCQNRQLMRDVYISIEALRNSTDLLHSRISSWIASVLNFREARGMDWVSRQQDILTALGVEADIVELLASDLELSWEGGCLWVREGAQVTHSAPLSQSFPDARNMPLLENLFKLVNIV